MANSSGHHKANVGSWVAVLMIIFGFTVGVFALVFNTVPLWIATGLMLVVGGIVAISSKLMEQAY